MFNERSRGFEFCSIIKYWFNIDNSPSWSDFREIMRSSWTYFKLWIQINSEFLGKDFSPFQHKPIFRYCPNKRKIHAETWSKQIHDLDASNYFSGCIPKISKHVDKRGDKRTFRGCSAKNRRINKKISKRAPDGIFSQRNTNIFILDLGNKAYCKYSRFNEIK